MNAKYFVVISIMVLVGVGLLMRQNCIGLYQKTMRFDIVRWADGSVHEEGVRVCNGFFEGEREVKE